MTKTISQSGRPQWLRAPARGFTMVEMAMSLVLVGLAVAGLIFAFKVYTANHAIETTKKNAQATAQAIENFILENGRFPCPAAIDLPIDSPRYGHEADCATLRGYKADGSASSPVAAGDFDGGIWVEQGAQTATARVVRGMVPFQALNIPEHYVIDGYNSRLFYAVTAAQTNPDTFMREGGQIAVIDKLGQAGSDAVKTNHFIVFSAGPNKQGSYTRYGVAGLPCGQGLDSENCNTSSANRAAIYRAAQRSTSTDPAHSYDDYMVNTTTMQMPLWRLDDADSFNMRLIDTSDRVLMGDLAPAMSPLEVRVDIGGTTRTSSDTYSGGYCLNSDGTRCFTSNLIANETPEMNCEDGGYARASSGRYMTGIARSEMRCATELAYNCPSGQYLSGMSADGQPTCKAYTFVLPPTPDTPAPPVAEPPPVTEPPVTEPPVTKPPVSEPPPSAPEDPPVVEPPVTEVPVVNGACGSANGQTYATTPASGLCSAGTASGVSPAGLSWSWSCQGSNGGTTSNCSATREIKLPECSCPSGYKQWGYGGVIYGCVPSKPAGMNYTHAEIPCGADVDNCESWKCLSYPAGCTGGPNGKRVAAGATAEFCNGAKPGSGDWIAVMN